MPKRNLFEELKNGLEDAKVYEQNKLTLKTTIIASKERTQLSASETHTVREMLMKVRTI